MPNDLTDLVELLVCPNCHGSLQHLSHGADCSACGSSFRKRDGVLVLLVNPDSADDDEIDHAHGDHKAAQARFFDRDEAEEFETTRPAGTPDLYRWLMDEKFRRAMRGLNTKTAERTALTVCGGSGMDAEFLARTGARVITSDISLGAARRAAERARRTGLPILSIVADIERLPFLDRTIDHVYVHDGLHHLSHPERGIDEMLRVAAGTISITEPAQAVVTSIAVRAGIALDTEEAGNRVARLNPGEVARRLEAAGFKVLTADRYAMYYRHRPGRIMEQLSRPAVLPIAIGYWRALSALVGRFGNKLAVVAVREP
jgi:SAM-dependent methyltransferase